MKRMADRAQIESDEVAAVNVLNTGDRDINARKINMDDFKALTPERGCVQYVSVKVRVLDRLTIIILMLPLRNRTV